LQLSTLKSALFGYIVPIALYIFISISHLNAAEKESVDLIVYGEYLITMDESKPIIKNGAVAIQGNQIIAVAEKEQINRRYRSLKNIQGKSRILMPGLINGHTHSAMSLFRGMADDLELMPWLNNFIFPMEAKFVDKDFIATGTQLACWEMIRGGTTTFVDMYFYPEIISQQTVNCGLRAIVGAPMIDYPSPGFEGWHDSFAAAVKYVEKWQGRHERIIPAFAPHAPYTVSAKHLRVTANKARELKAPISIHLAESLSELKMLDEQYRQTPIKFVEQQGLFEQNKVIGAHMVHPTDADISILASKKVGAIHNPTSNLKLAAGIAPVVSMLKQGVKVGLGTDGAASNNDLDMWEEIRLAALLHKVKSNDPTAIPALTALKMATSEGAKAIGLGEITGQLKPGMKADMIQLSIDNLRLAPLYNVISHLVYVADSNDVVTTIVSGKLLMVDQKILTIDEKWLTKAVIQKSLEIKKALKTNKNCKEIVNCEGA